MNFKAARLMPVLLLSASAMGQEVAFSLTPAEFQQRFSAIATKDGGDRILNLQREKGVYKAVLADFQFQKSVAAFKQMNLANGHFVMQTKILLKVNPAGRITEIVVFGSRADPMNLIQGFVGAMGIVTKTLDPSMPQEQVTKLIVSLGLLRGDDDPTTGKVVTQFATHGAYGCLVRNSSITSQVGCSIVPRS